MSAWGLSGQPFMLVHHSPSLMLSHLSSRNTMVMAGPGLMTWFNLLYLVYPLQPVNASASILLNQLSIEILRCRGKVWPLNGPEAAMHGYCESAGQRQIPRLWPQ